jgi:hypothetical protein
LEKFDIVLRLRTKISKNNQGGLSGYIVIDDDIINKFTFTQDQVYEQKFSLELTEGPHKFGFTLNNKHPRDTVIDEQGNILDDSHITLEYFEIDEIDLSEMYKLKGKFVHASQEPDSAVNTCIGYNGVYYFEFETPYYEWLLSVI